jgi:DNA-binding CsgD family transcriptional regulator
VSTTESFPDLDLAVYEAVINPPGLPLDPVARHLGRSPTDVLAAFERLVELCLVRRDGERYCAVSPALAESQALGAEALELSSRRAHLEARRMAIRRATPHWTTAMQQLAPSSAVETVFEAEAITNILMHYAESCQSEVLSVAPGQGPARVDARTRMANLYSLQRGVSTRAVYQHSALRDRSTRAYLRELTENGALIRVAPSLPGRSLVIDRAVALLPIPHPDLPNGGLAVVREASVVAWVVATFEQLWAGATSLEEMLGGNPSGPELDQTRSAILRLMGEGEKDEAISRRLSISVRTCRRHIADYMAQVGATSRFQAGAIAARDGHLDAPTIT